MSSNPLQTETPVYVSGNSQKEWSYSRLSMFEGCERQFYYKYVLELPYPSSPPMQTGKIFHSAIELMIRDGYSPSEALYYSIGVNGGLPEGEKAYFLINLLKKAYDRLPKGEYVEISSEMELEVKTTRGKIRGIVDVIIDDPTTDTTYIWDFKTGWSSFSAENHIQLAIYGWLFQQIRGYVGSTFKGRLVFPRLGVEEDSEVELTEEKLVKARNWIVRQINRIEAKDPGYMNDWEMSKERAKCEHCPYAARCASGLLSDLPGTGAPSNATEAEKIGSYLLAQETALKNMKNGLKKWVGDNDSVKVGTGVWMMDKSQPNPKCEDLDALIDYANRNNLKLKDLLSTKSSTLEEWLNNDQTGELQQLVSYTKGRNSFKYVN
ncbi:MULTISPECIES: PD-(D/E)XK nuclease family protein [Bacillus]|uniref:PD-(D/E)XK nuclease family protein n=1 Tax=Bacillus TaxID=1386 RepID=UPI000C75E418|nr:MULTISPECIES: PD-(D/E)XK nuclease family protein [Bacillus]MCP1161394.1 PD-(D/E)XK nuclease family protein [Bacillus infantis]PLR70489.1 PD-(D/E)XK nuclease family protein [Bacillus sp. UMB0728]